MKRNKPDKESVENVLNFFKLMDFPGIRKGEDDQEIDNYFKSILSYNGTPDLIAGLDNFEEVSIDDLFFIDVNEPSIDNLFKKHNKIEGASDNLSQLFNRLKENKSFSLEEMPKEHYGNYLKAMNNKKIMKYCYRKEGTISKNFGMVHHINLGEIKNKRIQESEKFFLLIDLMKFYGSLSPQSNIDISNFYKRLMHKIIETDMSDPNDPYVCLTGRDYHEWKDVPCFFYLLHINAIKDGKLHHFALWIINICHLYDPSININYQIHDFFRKIASDPTVKEVSSEEYENIEHPHITLAPVTFFTKENGIKKVLND
ncbi:MAG: hypothetical protein D3910_26510 [Candidatus Electrothrix sp. ATG2]|nr:hypothetical protein [Candidatus Electrothrix sp. ATG2]